MEHRSGRGKEGEPADYLERWLKVQRNYSFAGSPSPPLFFFVPLFDGDASEKVRLYEDALKIYGISEWFSSRYTHTHTHKFLGHTMKSTCSYFYVHMHAHGKISCRIYIYTHFYMKRRKARSSTDDAICANDQVCPAGFVCGVGKQHASGSIKKGSRTHSRVVA